MIDCERMAQLVSTEGTSDEVGFWKNRALAAEKELEELRLAHAGRRTRRRLLSIHTMRPS